MLQQNMRYWIEKTLVTNRKDRNEGDFKFGSRLWSPTKSKDGKDIYSNMKLISPDDVIFHLVDNKRIVGVSRASSSFKKTHVEMGSPWDGDIFYVELRDFQSLDPSIDREHILNKKNAVLLRDLAKKFHVFFTSNLELRQGAYITECPNELCDLLSSIYLDISGMPLPYSSSNGEDEEIEVYLKMKNASAEGKLNLQNYNVTVLKGAIFEEYISDSFKSHNYLKLRQEIMNSGNVVDLILQKDYKFTSLSAAAAVLGGRSAAGPNEWKTKDGKTVNQYLEFRNHWLGLKKLIEDKKNSIIDTTYLIEIQQFVDAFPIEKIKTMKLDEYDNPGKKDTFTYLLEYKTKSLSGGSFFNQRNKLFYYSNGDYLCSKYIEDRYPNLTMSQRFELYKNDLSEFIAEYDETNYVAKNYSIFSANANYIRSKLINLFYPDTLIHLDSVDIFRKILQHFGFDHTKLNDIIEMNIAFKKEIYSKIPETKNMGIKLISDILWEYYQTIIDVKEVIIDEHETPINTEELFFSDELIEEIIYLLKKKKNVILQGAPGVGKTFSIKKIINSHFNIISSDDQIRTIQFHQSYSYEEFIEGLRPRTYDSGFSLIPGIFKQFLDEHVKLNPGRDYFFIIDEINRGNLSKIFGELLMLIEADKRDVEKVILPYSNEEFYIPSNLYIIGTMNTADRSLALMDYALRRRFSFVTLKPMYNTPKFNDYMKEIGLNDVQLSTINTTMEKINQYIHKDLGSNFEVGHSYFIDTKIENFDVWYQNIIKYDIIPILKEYYFDDEDKLNDFLKDLGLI